MHRHHSCLVPPARRQEVRQLRGQTRPSAQAQGCPQAGHQARQGEPSLGHTKIRDALWTGLGIEIGRTTVANILAAAGIEPAPEREKSRTWKQFMKTHWDSLCGCDFFTVEALGFTGTIRYMVFFVVAVKTRAVEIAGIATNPDGEWMLQMARNLTDSVDGSLRNATYLIPDRDPIFTEAFEAILRERGVKCVRIPAQSPNCNPHAERLVETIKYESLNHLVLFGERHPLLRIRTSRTFARASAPHRRSLRLLAAGRAVRHCEQAKIRLAANRACLASTRRVCSRM